MNLCGKCGKEIPTGQEEYLEVGGVKILQPHKECREEIKAQINDPKWNPEQGTRKKKP
jgi:hypothetical protein